MPRYNETFDDSNNSDGSEDMESLKNPSRLLTVSSYDPDGGVAQDRDAEMLANTLNDTLQPVVRNLIDKFVDVKLRILKEHEDVCNDKVGHLLGVGLGWVRSGRVALRALGRPRCPSELAGRWYFLFASIESNPTSTSPLGHHVHNTNQEDAGNDRLPS